MKPYLLLLAFIPALSVAQDRHTFCEAIEGTVQITIRARQDGYSVDQVVRMVERNVPDPNAQRIMTTVARSAYYQPSPGLAEHYYQSCMEYVRED